MSEPQLRDFAKFLVTEAPRILPRTPCSLWSIASSAVRDGVCMSADELVEGVLSLRCRFANTVILEREGSMGHFLIFYHVHPLAIFAGISTDKLGTLQVTAGGSEPFGFRTSLESLFTEIRQLTTLPSALEQLRLESVREEFPEAPLTLICSSESRAACLREGKVSCLSKIHFERVLHSHTDVSLGDCSYLDTCFKWRQCKFVHYKVVYPDDFKPTKLKMSGISPPQYINADLLQLDLGALGSDYAAMIIDPPWEIHTNPGQSDACTDEKVMALNVGALQKSGIAFLWVTGRVLDFGRQCLAHWGYEHVEEVIWLKTNQLGRTICTGRTGHWLNHTKEHVLVGAKGGAALKVPGLLHTDVLVSTALGRSQKPEELYAIIDRLVGIKAKKIELFGRKSNIRPGWLTVGNEMGATRVYDAWLKKQLRLP